MSLESIQPSSGPASYDGPFAQPRKQQDSATLISNLSRQRLSAKPPPSSPKVTYRTADITREALKFQQEYCPHLQDTDQIAHFRQEIKAGATAEVKKAYLAFGKKLAMLVIAVAMVAVCAAFLAGAIASGGALPILLGLGIGLGVLFVAGLSKSIDKSKSEIRIRENFLKNLGGNHAGFLQSLSKKYVYISETRNQDPQSLEELIETAKQDPKKFSLSTKQHPKKYEAILLDKTLRAKWDRIENNLRLTDKSFEFLRTIVEKDIADIDRYLAEKYGLFRIDKLTLDITPESTEPEQKIEMAKEPEKKPIKPSAKPIPAQRPKPIELNLEQIPAEPHEELIPQFSKSKSAIRVQAQYATIDDIQIPEKEEEMQIIEVQLGPRVGGKKPTIDELLNEFMPHRTAPSKPKESDEPEVEASVSVSKPPQKSKSALLVELEKINSDLNDLIKSKSSAATILKAAAEANEKLEELPDKALLSKPGAAQEKLLFGKLKQDVLSILIFQDDLQEQLDTVYIDFILKYEPSIIEKPLPLKKEVTELIKLKQSVQEIANLEKKHPKWFNEIIDKNKIESMINRVNEQIEKIQQKLAEVREKQEIAVEHAEQVLQDYHSVKEENKEKSERRLQLRAEISSLEKARDRFEIGLREASFSPDTINKELGLIDKKLQELQINYSRIGKPLEKPQQPEIEAEASLDKEIYLKLSEGPPSQALKHLKQLKISSPEVFNGLLRKDGFHRFGNRFKNRGHRFSLSEEQLKIDILKLNSYIKIEKSKLELTRDQRLALEKTDESPFEEGERIVPVDLLEGQIEQEQTAEEAKVQAEGEATYRAEVQAEGEATSSLLSYMVTNVSKIGKEDLIQRVLESNPDRMKLKKMLTSLEKWISGSEKLSIIKDTIERIEQVIELENKLKAEKEAEAKRLEEEAKAKQSEKPKGIEKAAEVEEELYTIESLVQILTKLSEESENTQDEMLTQLLQIPEATAKLEPLLNELQSSGAYGKLSPEVQATYEILARKVKEIS